MLHICLIAVFGAMVLVREGMGWVLGGEGGKWAGGVLVLGACGMAMVVMMGAGRLAHRRAEASGSLRSIEWLDKWMLACRLLATGATVGGIVLFGWLEAVRGVVGDWVLVDEAIALAPLLAVFLTAWWAAYPLERLLREAVLMRNLDAGKAVYALPTRGQFVLMHARHQLLLLLLPMTVLWGWSEVLRFSMAFVERRAERGGWYGRAWEWIDKGWGGSAVEAMQLGGLVLIVVLMPLAIRHVWDTVPLREGAMAERLMGMCRVQGVRVRSLLVWRTGGTMINGAVLGVSRYARYILLTDALIDFLPGEHVEAVMAHELAHAKHRHVPWLTIALMCTAGSALLLVHGVLVVTGLGSLAEVPAGLELPISAAAMGLGVVVFGWVSRRFEWQADAFAARHLSEYPPVREEEEPEETGGLETRPPRVQALPSKYIAPHAVGAMVGALEAVAELNHMPRERFSFRHGSIAERVRRLKGLQGVAVGAMPIDRQVRWVKGGIAVMGVVMVVWTVVGLMRGREEPRRPEFEGPRSELPGR